MLKQSKKTIGYTGESIACGYLEHKHYCVIDRNYSTKFGEIDIIAKSPGKVLVFCEVKTILSNKNDPTATRANSIGCTQKFGKIVQKLGKVMKSPAKSKYLQINDSIRPEDQMSYSKIQKFRKISEWYANNNLKKLGYKNYRLDLLAIDLYKDAADVRWYKNVC